MKRILLAYTLSALCLLPAFAGGGEGALPISYVNPFTVSYTHLTLPTN